MSIDFKPIDEALFGRIRRELLSVFLFNPDRSFYLLELVSLLRTGRGGVQRELSNLVAAGIVTRRREGVKVLFGVAGDCPVHAELRELLSAMTDRGTALADALSGFSGGIEVAVLLDTGVEPSTGPLKLLIVSDDVSGDIARELERVLLLTGIALDVTMLDAAGARELMAGEPGTHWALDPAARYLIGSSECLSVSRESPEEENHEPDLFSAAGLQWR
ncbi:MAG: winged helix-turn-helix transcriptional regulator [Candidatus Fermentibacteraceae bacterium]|nr:winged helix-turn-helix transcriptional regulator [Candidatus Fermentibacteraceae bacterium]MBN2609620.1 winged helix-turn-helix transcriptional regulator [Candidatus Fermentibacteraceae bacterium]